MASSIDCVVTEDTPLLLGLTAGIGCETGGFLFGLFAGLLLLLEELLPPSLGLIVNVPGVTIVS